MITQHSTGLPVDPQHDAIRDAYVRGMELGLIPWGPLMPTIPPEKEWGVFNELTLLRSGLKRAGVTFPTKMAYRDRLSVLLMIDSGAWRVKNLAKGTEYTVSAVGFRLDCTCDVWGCGICKHRDAVEDWRDAHEDFTAAAVAPALPTAAAASVVQAMPVQPVSTPTIAFPFPDGFTPSAEQAQALKMLGDWYYGTERVFRLTGSAGTGKSTAIQSLLKYLKAQPLPPKMAVAAPINKAVKVQRQILKSWGLGDIPTHTCAQLFGLKRKIVDGVEVFEVDRDAEPAYQNYDLIVVDEASTINEELWEILIDAAHGSFFSCRFIIMGDPAQLPPINEGESLALRWPCPAANLSEVQRYDGPISVLADDMRNHLDRPSLPTITTLVDPETKKGVYAVDRATWQSLICKVFTGSEYQENPDSAKILAYTNKKVNALNVLVRNALGYSAPWVVGERIIATAPYAPDGGVPIISTSDESTIKGIYEASVSGRACWFLQLDNGETIPVPRHPAEFDAELAGHKKDKAWGKYWGARDSMAQIAYGYALTVHRSQGSTYRYCFVDVPNFKGCKGQHRTTEGQRIYERNQLAYVAFTRPSDRLIVCTH